MLGSYQPTKPCDLNLIWQRFVKAHVASPAQYSPLPEQAVLTMLKFRVARVFNTVDLAAHLGPHIDVGHHLVGRIDRSGSVAIKIRLKEPMQLASTCR